MAEMKAEYRGIKLSYSPGGTEIDQVLWKTGRISEAEHLHALQPRTSTPQYIPNRNVYICSPETYMRIFIGPLLGIIQT
jgi:hypothetical protein